MMTEGAGTVEKKVQLSIATSCHCAGMKIIFEV